MLEKIWATSKRVFDGGNVFSVWNSGNTQFPVNLKKYYPTNFYIDSFLNLSSNWIRNSMLLRVAPFLATLITPSYMFYWATALTRDIRQTYCRTQDFYPFSWMDGQSLKNVERKRKKRKQEQIVLERSARLNLDPKIWRCRRNVLKEKMMFVGGK